MRYPFLFLSASIMLLSSCRYFGGERVSGNGRVVTRNITVSAFDAVELHGGLNVQLRQDAKASAAVLADENLFEFLDIYNDGNTLVVKTKKGYRLNPSKEIIVYAAAPAFREVSVSGSGDVTSAGTLSGNQPIDVHVSGSGDINMQVSVPKVSTEISGSGTIALKGNATDFVATVNGSGDIKSFGLVTENAEVHLSGSADAEVTANKHLDISISGSGSVQYRGNPAVKQHIAGSGSVERAG